MFIELGINIMEAILKSDIRTTALSSQLYAHSFKQHQE